jgi:dTDP-L-rhamnose 4-epimerase
MDRSTCIVTGGAGFIGCSLSPGLVVRFDRVIVLDKLHSQIHPAPFRPAALHPSVDFHRADVTEPAVWDDLLAQVRPQVVVHLAAETGTGQSLTEASRHAQENVLGTAAMLDGFTRHRQVPDLIILASSRAVYGEGGWRRTDGTVFCPRQRGREQLARGEWDFSDAEHVPCSASVTQPHPSSIYGATKLAQEHMLESWSCAFGNRLTILRLQNAYGPGQSLINSYTGIVSLFARLAREGKIIPLYEDGRMLRDFIHIEDVRNALLAAIDAAPAGINRFDVGLGNATTIARVAELIASRYHACAPYVSGAYRHGDVRHASCDITSTLQALPWRPQWSLERGVESLCAWVDAELGTKSRQEGAVTSNESRI